MQKVASLQFHALYPSPNFISQIKFQADGMDARYAWGASEMYKVLVRKSEGETILNT